jgi:hypothetical protein
LHHHIFWSEAGAQLKRPAAGLAETCTDPGLDIVGDYLHGDILQNGKVCIGTLAASDWQVQIDGTKKVSRVTAVRVEMRVEMVV